MLPCSLKWVFFCRNKKTCEENYHIICTRVQASVDKATGYLKWSMLNIDIITGEKLGGDHRHRVS